MDAVLRELAAGRKTSHWMWFVFPQIAGLGRSEMAQRYAIASREEAVAYLAHPILGPRLLECTSLVLGVEGRTAHDIFGSPDDMKFHSSLTLFDAVSADDNASQPRSPSSSAVRAMPPRSIFSDQSPMTTAAS